MIKAKTYFFYLTLTLFLITSVSARIRKYETTRLKSTGGAGVGAALINESVVLNPASLALFNIGTIYAEKTDLEFSGGESEQRKEHNNYHSKSSENMALIITDTSKAVKGSFGYIKQRFGEHKEERFSVASAHMISDHTGIGVQFHHIKETNNPFLAENSEKYDQVNFGSYHIVNKNLTMGVMVVDPFKKRRGQSRGILGLQYVFHNMLAFMADVGADYNQDLSSTLFYKLGAQINFFADFYVRAGHFNDKSESEKGNGVGISWIGPRLSFDIAYKTTKPIDSQYSELQAGENLKELSFSLTMQL